MFTNLRKAAIAGLAAFSLVAAGSLSTADEAQAGGKDIAGAVIGGLVVGAIIGSQLRPAYGAPVYHAPVHQAPVYGVPYGHGHKAYRHKHHNRHVVRHHGPRCEIVRERAWSNHGPVWRDVRICR